MHFFIYGNGLLERERVIYKKNLSNRMFSRRTVLFQSLEYMDEPDSFARYDRRAHEKVSPASCVECAASSRKFEDGSGSEVVLCAGISDVRLKNYRALPHRQAARIKQLESSGSNQAA